MKGFVRPGIVLGAALAVLAPLAAAELKIDLKNEKVGKPPEVFEPMVGTWSPRTRARR